MAEGDKIFYAERKINKIKEKKHRMDHENSIISPELSANILPFFHQETPVKVFLGGRTFKTKTWEAGCWERNGDLTNLHPRRVAGRPQLRIIGVNIRAIRFFIGSGAQFSSLVQWTGFEGLKLQALLSQHCDRQ